MALRRWERNPSKCTPTGLGEIWSDTVVGKVWQDLAGNQEEILSIGHVGATRHRFKMKDISEGNYSAKKNGETETKTEIYG